METNQPPNFEGSESRRSERPLLRIPLQVEGYSEDGRPFKERTTTILINRTGARISLKNSVRPGNQITITNLLMQQSSTFRVIGRTENSIGTGSGMGCRVSGTHRGILGGYIPRKKRRPSHGEHY